MFRLNIFLWIFLDYSEWNFRFQISLDGVKAMRHNFLQRCYSLFQAEKRFYASCINIIIISEIFLYKRSGDTFFIKFYRSLVKSQVTSRREQMKNYPKIKTRIT